MDNNIQNRIAEAGKIIDSIKIQVKKVLIGQNIFVKTSLNSADGRVIPILTMGPICITPAEKRKGYGKMLLDYSLEQATRLGYGAVMFEGNIDFYGKSGFVFARK